MKGQIKYELIILYDRYQLRPKDVISLGFKPSTAYKYAKISKNAIEKAKTLMLNKVIL